MCGIFCSYVLLLLMCLAIKTFQFRSSFSLQIDEDILQEVVKMGFDRNTLVDSLRNRVQNEVIFGYSVMYSFCTFQVSYLDFMSGYCYILFDVRQPVSGFHWLPPS